MSQAFGERLHQRLERFGALCVGIDPHAGLLDAWGLPRSAAGAERFARTVVEALAGRVAVLKPQSAFFECHGSAGIAALERTLADIRGTDSLALLDVKRGDIGSTMQAYASAYLDPSSPLAADAVTLSPYLGFGSLQPAFEMAASAGAGVFVLALTSNPEGPEVQGAHGADGRTVAGTVLDHLAALNAGASPLGSFGAVVGVTVGETAYDLTRVNGPLLAPGFGAQGGTAADLARVFGAALPRVVVSTSRDVLRAGPSVAALREAADRSAAQLADVLADR